MAFYVPLGIRGPILHFGTCLISVMARWIYWRTTQRKLLAADA